MSLKSQSTAGPRSRAISVEWVTLALFCACLGVWGLGLFMLPLVSMWVAAGTVTLALVLHSSLSHEVLHGHPFASRRANEALVIVTPGLFVPYLRFRDTHLAHHCDSRLTDPYDDPESNYLDPHVWAGLSGVMRAVLQINSTLAGRILIGPAVSQVAFMRADWAAWRAGDERVRRAWALHIPGVVLVLAMVWVAAMPLWVYLVACYAALSILKIRTFAEHRAHVDAQGRTVIVEDRGILAFVFLNNNLHVVHHMHPQVPWYRLPALYRAHAQHFAACNRGYVYRSYGQIIARHLLRPKDPVPHPLWSRGDGT